MILPLSFGSSSVNRAGVGRVIGEGKGWEGQDNGGRMIRGHFMILIPIILIQAQREKCGLVWGNRIRYTIAARDFLRRRDTNSGHIPKLRGSGFCWPMIAFFNGKFQEKEEIAIS